LRTVAERKIVAEHLARLVAGRSPPEIIVKKTQSLGTRQKASDGAIEMHEIEQSTPLRDLASAAEILQIDEVDLPIPTLAA
jgi:hypothetical protein